LIVTLVLMTLSDLGRRYIILPLPLGYGALSYSVCLTSTGRLPSVSLSAEYIERRTQKPRKTKIGGIQRWCVSDVCLLRTSGLENRDAEEN